MTCLGKSPQLSNGIKVRFELVIRRLRKVFIKGLNKQHKAKDCTEGIANSFLILDSQYTFAIRATRRT